MNDNNGYNLAGTICLSSVYDKLVEIYFYNHLQV